MGFHGAGEVLGLAAQPAFAFDIGGTELPCDYRDGDQSHGQQTGKQPSAKAEIR
jgi:hypothetical protein